jgi:hypothetical protein
MHWQGRQELEAKHAVAHRTIFRHSNLQIVEPAVRFLSPSIALAHTSTQLNSAESLRESNTPEVGRTLMTCVLVKEADRGSSRPGIIPTSFLSKFLRARRGKP